MKAKHFITALLFTLFLLVASISCISDSFAKISTSNNHYVLDNYKERVLVDGKWWIIEYSDTGIIVSVYKEVDD